MSDILHNIEILGISLNLSNNYLDLHREYQFDSSDFTKFKIFFENMENNPASEIFSSNYEKYLSMNELVDQGKGDDINEINKTVNCIPFQKLNNTELTDNDFSIYFSFKKTQNILMRFGPPNEKKISVQASKTSWLEIPDPVLNQIVNELLEENEKNPLNHIVKLDIILEFREGLNWIKVKKSVIPQYWLIRAEIKGKLWDSWKKNNIITIGWDIGKDLRDLSEREIKEKLEIRSYSDISSATWQLKSFAMLNDDTDKNFNKGDYVIVLGDAAIEGIAILHDEEPYIYKEEGLPKDKTHTYWKNVKFIFNKGPIKIRDLPDEFKQRGENPIHLVQTLHRYNVDEEVFNKLLTHLEDLSNKSIINLLWQYVEFSKELMETDENIQKISHLIRNTEEELIKEYYSNFFNQYLIESPAKYKRVFPFFRILTLNKIRLSSEDDGAFKTIEDFIEYKEDFIKKLRNSNFPDNFYDEITSIQDVDSFIHKGVEYTFNMDFIKENIEISPNKLIKQFSNYGDFKFFRHFKLYYSKQGNQLRDYYPILWEKLREYLIELLGLNPDDYFFDQCTFYKKRGSFETDDTWGALVKKEIGGISIEEDRKNSLQLYFNINPNGLKIGTYLGSRTSDQIKGFIMKNVSLNRNILIKELKNLERKYHTNIKIDAEIKNKTESIHLNKDLDDEIIQEDILKYLKINFSILYEHFQGDKEEFNDIINDLFEIYNILTEVGIEPPEESFLEQNLINIIFSLKEEQIKKLENKFIGIKIKKIIEKILGILNSGKNVILTGAPGTGKTEILQFIFKDLKDNSDLIKDITFTTASSDWTIFETIGGLVPSIKSELEFNPGIFLRCFMEDNEFTNKWLIIDELNRANIDKAFGYFFSLLSDQEVELPFKTIRNQFVKIIPLKKWLNNGLNVREIIEIVESSSDYFRFFISPNWRIGGTINSSDKASLHQLSHAFMRRFGFVNVPIPDISNFMEEFKPNFKSTEEKQIHLKKVWDIINNNNFKLGPAIIIDMDKFLKTENIDIIDAFEAYILPQIDTLPDEIFEKIIKSLIKEFVNEEKVDEKRFENFLNVID